LQPGSPHPLFGYASGYLYSSIFPKKKKNNNNNKFCYIDNKVKV